MASFVYNEGGRGIAALEIDWDNDTIKGALLMNTTTCDTENDAMTFLSSFATLARSDDSTYAGDVTLATNSTDKVDASNRTELRVSVDAVFSGMAGDGSGTTYDGMLIYKFVTNDAASIPIAYIEFTTPIAIAATSVTVPVSTTVPILVNSTSAP